MNDPAETPHIMEIALEEAFQYSPVNTQIFTPFLVARLEEHPATVVRTCEYQVILQDIRAAGTRSLAVRWTWTEAMIPPVPLAAQQAYITEAAAYGLAFAVLARFTSAVLIDVAERGERFDYVFADQGRLCGLEVSGSQTEDKQTLKDRHAQKIRQLRDNPQGWGGYVVIVGFTRREVILSFHQAERDNQS